MIIYFDGAEYRQKNNVILSYGVLFHGGQEKPIETSGFYELGRNMLGVHEEVAFVEAFLLLKKENISYKEVSFYSDSETLVNASFWLEEKNYVPSKKLFIENIMKRVLKNINKLEIFDEVMDCLKNSRFQKVKAHKKNTSIDNIRVDYLAKNYKKENILCYEEFLTCSFETFNNQGIPTLTNLPFMPKNKTHKIRV
jgi:ribonuclease HI